jgi:hypothetical protein
MMVMSVYLNAACARHVPKETHGSRQSEQRDDYRPASRTHQPPWKLRHIERTPRFIRPVSDAIAEDIDLLHSEMRYLAALLHSAAPRSANTQLSDEADGQSCELVGKGTLLLYKLEKSPRSRAAKPRETSTSTSSRGNTVQRARTLAPPTHDRSAYQT